jgi:hypothetical protein
MRFSKIRRLRVLFHGSSHVPASSPWPEWGEGKPLVRMSSNEMLQDGGDATQVI